MFAIMTAQGATKRGFPRMPYAGQMHWHDGQAWTWFPPSVYEGTALSDVNDGLGFWGAIISAAIGTVGSLFGSKKKGISEAEAQAAVENARLEEQLKAAQQPRGAEAVFNKKTLPFWALIIFGYLALR
jgi:FAD/FMN-containing dehydrogenase